MSKISKIYLHRQYRIQEKHWRDIYGHRFVHFQIFDDEKNYLWTEKSLNRAKDWIDAEQAGEHDQQLTNE